LVPSHGPKTSNVRGAPQCYFGYSSVAEE
jgi:hypothetical protein